MSIDLYKAEAKRLAEHLADVHGVKLKHSSVLEAVAALHGARDWNTLMARDKPGLLQRAASVLRTPSRMDVVVNLDQLLFQSSTKGLRFGLSSDQTAPADLDDSAVRQHTLVVGPMGYGWRTLLEHLSVQQLVRGGGLLVLDTVPDERLPKLLAAAAARAGRDDFSGWSSLQPTEVLSGMRPTRYDLFAGQDAGTIAERVLACLPDFEQNPGSDFYRQQCRFALTAILQAQLALRRDVSLESLCDLLQQPRRLLGLREELGQAQSSALPEQQESLSNAHHLLDSLLSAYRKRDKMGDTLDEDRFRSTLGGILGRLVLMGQPDVLPNNLSKDIAALDLADIVCKRECAYLSVPLLDKADSVRALAQMLMHDLRAAVSAPGGPAVSRGAPLFTVVLPMCHTLLRALGASFFAQARGLGIGFILHVPSLVELEEAGLAETVLGNTATKVFFKAPSTRALHAATEHLDCIAPKEYVSSKGSDWEPRKAESPASWRDRIAAQGLGDALLVTRDHLRQIHVCMMSSDE